MYEYLDKFVAEYFQALTHPTRLEILDLLKYKEQMCVCEIVLELKKEQSNISRHLQALKQAGILELKSEGIRSIYKIKNNNIYKIIDLAKDILRTEIRIKQKYLARI